jgi:hypothetical protein
LSGENIKKTGNVSKGRAKGKANKWKGKTIARRKEKLRKQLVGLVSIF